MYTYEAEIIGAHDGDTLTLNIDLGLETHRIIQVRLLGIDAPELNTVEGKRTLLKVLDLINTKGANVIISTVKDRKEKYGRYLADISFRDGTHLNTWLVDNKYAKEYDGGKR